MLVLVLLCYLGLALMLTLLQRKLIYLPTRAAAIPSSAAGLGAGRVHDVAFMTPDGLELHGWHFLPAGRTCGSRGECDAELAGAEPVVLFFHGNGGDRRHRVDDSEIFTRCESHVFLIDYRGYGENPGSPSEAGLLLDARAAWRYLVDERNVQPERIILYGESLGGAVAIKLAAELCDAETPPAALITRSTFTSLADAAAVHYAWLPVRWLLLDRFESAEAISRVTCPILQLHGDSDTIVPLSLGARLFNAAPARSRSGIEKQFIKLPATDHNDVLFVAHDAFAAAIADFLRKLRQSAPGIAGETE